MKNCASFALLFLTAIQATAMKDKDRSWSMTDDDIDKFYGSAAADRGSRSQREALAAWEKGIAEARLKTPEQAIPYLGSALLKLSSRNIFQLPERVAVYDAAQALLLTIPGHAEYYRDRILDAQEHLKRMNGLEAFAGPAYVEYRNEQRYGFKTLPHLPSPETVRVYGELLSNHWVPPGNEAASIAEKLMPLSERALGGLAKLPIQNKPFGSLSRDNLAEAHAAWLQWYEEIKDGRRTFRFDGDPVEYDLNGPAAGQKLERIERDTKRDRERAAGRRDTGGDGGDPERSSVETPPTSATPVALIAAGALALGSLLWYAWRKRVAGKS